MKNAYRSRLIDPVLEEVMAGLPAVLLVGPRGSGKTTTARRFANTFVRLDREREASPFRADPDELLASLETPVLIDEWQLVPEVLSAVKRAIDDEPGVGRFLLTGSVRAELLEASWAATGRIVRVNQWGLCERELQGDPLARSFFDRAFDGELAAMCGKASVAGLRDYVDLALRGGYPSVALQVSETLRLRWHRGYVDQLVMRDAALADEHRDPVKLRRYLTALAANTAGVVEHKRLYDAAGIARTTAVSYDSLLELLFVSEQIPAWHTNQLNRLTRSSKRYLVDVAMIGPLLGVDARAVLRNGDLLGRVIDTFVLSQLRPEIEVASHPPKLYHLRHEDGAREIDLIAEGPDGRVLAMEMKASASPDLADAKHLIWLRDQLGEAFAGGIVFHTGPRGFVLDSQVYALPIASLWAK